MLTTSWCIVTTSANSAVKILWVWTGQTCLGLLRYTPFDGETTKLDVTKTLEHQHCYQMIDKALRELTSLGSGYRSEYREVNVEIWIFRDEFYLKG